MNKSAVVIVGLFFNLILMISFAMFMGNYIDKNQTEIAEADVRTMEVKESDVKEATIILKGIDGEEIRYKEYSFKELPIPRPGDTVEYKAREQLFKGGSRKQVTYK